MAEDIEDEWQAASEAVAGRRDAREKAVRGKELLWLEVSAILFHHDPIGINFETNSDEYDAEAQTIVLRSIWK